MFFFFPLMWFQPLRGFDQKVLLNMSIRAKTSADIMTIIWSSEITSSSQKLHELIIPGDKFRLIPNSHEQHLPYLWSENRIHVLILVKFRENKNQMNHNKDSEGVQKEERQKRFSSKIINSIKTKTLSAQVLSCWDTCQADDLSFLMRWCELVWHSGRQPVREMVDQFKAQPCNDEHSINLWIKINQFGVCGLKKKGHRLNLGRHLV